MRSRFAFSFALALAVAGFASGVAMPAHTDPPLKSVPFTDPVGDNVSSAPDITGGRAENWADGTIGFAVLLPSEQSFVRGRAVGIYIDDDSNRATGQFGDEYLIAAAGIDNAPVDFELTRWINNGWTLIRSASLSGRFDPGAGIVLTIDRSEIGVTTAFNYEVRAVSYVDYTGALFEDSAPAQPGFFSYTLGTPPPTATPAPKPKPKPKKKKAKPKKKHTYVLTRS